MTSQNDHCGSILPDHARQEPLIPAETGDSHLDIYGVPIRHCG